MELPQLSDKQIKSFRKVVKNGKKNDPIEPLDSDHSLFFVLGIM